MESFSHCRTMDSKNENNISKNRQSSRKKRNNSSTDGKENTPKKKKIKAKKCCSTDGIAKSKQLATKKQKTVVSKRRSNKEQKICANGKPMPSLADLEKMFEDSDTEEQSSKPDLETPKTPMKKSKTDNENTPFSPTTFKTIAERVMDIITNTEPTELLAQIPGNLEPDTPSLPVVPPKKRKKSDVPYIVGCKNRPYIPCKPSTNFCKGDDNYGVDNTSNNSDEDDQLPKKRRKKSKIGGFSKSIFNAQTDEIVGRLKSVGEGDNSSDNGNTEDYAFKAFMPSNQVVKTPISTENISDDSCDSNKTVDYCYRNFTAKEVGGHLIATDGNGSYQSNKTEVNDLNATLWGKSFSPLPSTSRDNDTFIKNDKLFNDSLTANTSHESEATPNEKLLFKNNDLSNESLPIDTTVDDVTEDKIDNDVQIVEIPYETIIVHDETIDHSSREMDKKYKCSEISGPSNEIPPDNPNDDDCVILIDDNSLKYTDNPNNNQTTIIIDDEYSNINIDDSYKNDVDEIIDIDSLIEENEAIIKRLDRTKRFDSVIEVVEIPNSPSPTAQQIEPVNISGATNNHSQPINIGQSLNTEPVNTSVISENNSTYTELISMCHRSNTNISNSNYTSAEQNSEHAAAAVNVTLENNNIDTNISTQMENRSSIGNIVADFFRRSEVLNATNNVFTRIDNLLSTLDALVPNNISEVNSEPTELPGYNSLTHYEQPYNTPHPDVSSIGAYSMGTLSNHHHQPRKTKKSKKSKTQESCVDPPPAETNSVEKPTRNIGDCPICMDNLSNNAIASTICGHVFCLACIQAAIRSSGKRCPTCRKVLKGAGYHQLYL